MARFWSRQSVRILTAGTEIPNTPYIKQGFVTIISVGRYQP